LYYIASKVRLTRLVQGSFASAADFYIAFVGKPKF
jgi:hypothetical protein